MKNLSFIIGSILVLSSCGKKAEDACFSNEPYHFKPTGSTFTDCSNADYILWEFSDGEGNEGRTVQHFFQSTGTKSVVQTVYSEDGRNSSSATESFYVGYKYIDSVVYSKLNVFNISDLDGGDRADIYVTYNGVRSNETYQDYFPTSGKLKFTFPDGGVYLGLVKNYDLVIYDENSSAPDVEINRESFMPYQNDDRYNNPLAVASDNKYEYNVFWHLGPTQP